MVKLAAGSGRFFLLPTAADPRLVEGESIVGVIQGGGGGGGGGAVRLPFRGTFSLRVRL